ncbi:hypothetical protein BHE74_00048220 [Ensete ventricosum]|nr:hypothetical protein GW17_00048942 [Ensete ventricosum]RWW45895.1 hypothetical protein BHE74_00048220 [Ensete ventricosum]RZS20572.1 hypothetical protein BHM03_00053102 [Ensete ventricosum]
MNSDGRRWERLTSGRNPSKQKHRLNAEEVLERKLGFDLFAEGDKRLGWLLTFSPSKFDLVAILQDKMEFEVESYLRRRYEGQITDVEIVDKEDLDLTTGPFLASGKAPYCPVHTGSAADRYADRSLLGGTAKIGRRRLISAVGGRFRSSAVD